jgi:signal transduction histidine kinase
MVEGQALTILAVDDTEAARYSVSRSLREGGYQVIEARTGAQALELARNDPALITLDINLPDMNGFDVCQKLKADPSTCDIPIIHISASWVDSEHKVRGLEGGADAYLAEPINRQELLATVAALLRMSQAQKEARRQTTEAQQAREALKTINETLEYRIKERTAELERSNAEIRQLSQRLLQAQDEERRRISRELHDSTGQLLVGLSLNLSNLRSRLPDELSSVAPVLDDTTLLVDEINRNIRTLSYLLHPPLLDEAGLAFALKWYVDGFIDRSNISVELELPNDLGRLPQDMETTIFRLVQESLTNVHRHSKSKTACIRIERNDHEVWVEVVDQGNGMTPPTRLSTSGFRPGVGILGMKERVRQFGGEFQIAFSETGTSVRARLPIKNNVLSSIA